jgi:hypothetical protein
MLLKGYSGDYLELLVHREGAKSKQQKNKHEYFSNIEFKSFGVPEIYPGKQEYLYSFIEGKDGINYVNDTKYDIELFGYKLVEIIKEIASKKAYEKIAYYDSDTSKKYVYDKLLKNGIDSRLCDCVCANVNLPISLAHGDMALDNFIITEYGSIYLIDFVPLFFPSYYLDISKLFLDIESNWIEIRKGIKISIYVKRTLREIIWGSLSVEYKNQHNALMVVSLARVLPYAKSLKEKQMIMKEIEKYSRKLK